MKKVITILILIIFICSNIVAINAAPATDNLDITVHKVITKPVVDGKITVEEWGEAVMSQAPGVGYTFFPDKVSSTSENGVKATIYMLWDEDGYYVAAVVEDASPFNQYTNLDIWNGDAIEFDTNFNKDDYTDRNRQCFGLNNDGEIYGGSYKVAVGVDWQENSDIEFKEFTAVRDGNNTNYEFFVPWENFCPEGKTFAKVGNIFRGNVQFHLALDGDYIECQRYVVYDAATETSTYPNFILADALEVAAVPETEQPEVSENPPTSDNMQSLTFAFAIISISCFLFILTMKKSYKSF
ncbi:MAG: Carbohydrate family 9 binding domain-like [Clostridia bacterium]|nr:Carbohydrate family 9 binding domain-like [Clostridia bacterium]